MYMLFCPIIPVYHKSTPQESRARVENKNLECGLIPKKTYSADVIIKVHPHLMQIASEEDKLEVLADDFWKQKINEHAKYSFKMTCTYSKFAVLLT